MPLLGTKTFWIPPQGGDLSQKTNQIIKNKGYINIQIRSVNYMSIGNFFQNIFKGKDTVVLTTTLKYETGLSSIEATSVQDIRKVKANTNQVFGLQSNIAVKVPSTADGISIEIKITAVKDDNLKAKFEMLNRPAYKSVLQLAPPVIGQIITISSLVKDLLTDADENTNTLECRFAGIISSNIVPNPVSDGRLTAGLLIIISTNDGQPFSKVDERKFSLKGNILYYNGKQVENTYVIISITFDEVKGADENSLWFKKYVEAYNNLDKIHNKNTPTDFTNILNDSKTLWMEGNTLLDSDNSYIHSEKTSLRNAALLKINVKYNELKTEYGLVPIGIKLEERIPINSNLETLIHGLPKTSQFIRTKAKIGTKKTIGHKIINMLSKENIIDQLIEKDTQDYLKLLKSKKLSFNLE